jgi:hypothetical protein
VLKLLPDIANECGAIASGGRILLISIVTSAIAQSQVLMIFPRRRPVSLAHNKRAMDHRCPIIRTIADAEGMHAQLLASVADTAASAIRSRVSSDVCARTE